jgi:hypothetical protein
MQVLKYECLLEVTENTEMELYLRKLNYVTDTKGTYASINELRYKDTCSSYFHKT